MRTAPSRDLTRRIRQLQSGLKRQRLDGMIVFNRANSFYLTGMESSLSYLLVTPREARLLVDGRYIEAARAAVEHCDVRLFTNLPKDLARWQNEQHIKTIGFEGTAAWEELERWREAMPGLDWRPAGELIARLRLIKSAAEIQCIERSARVADQLCEAALAAARPGATEWDLRNVIRAEADRLGADDLSFESIVGAGVMSSRPHYKPAKRLLERGDVLLIDLGARVDGYCSDMTRVVALGRKPARKLAGVYEAVLEAEQAAIAAVAPGVPCCEVDAVARQSLKKRRLARYFTHGLGHGVGIEIHEAPRLNKLTSEPLRPGMVITIEPGVYLPGLGGVRIEDLLVVTRNGCRVLSRTPRDLRILPFG